jgi:hypothetical protein
MYCATNEIEQLLAVPPPNFGGQTNNPHAIAHAVLENLRESGDEHLLFLRVVLELELEQSNRSIISNNNNHKEELLFHCITGVRHVFLTQWNRYSEDFKATIRDFLFLHLGDSHAHNAHAHAQESGNKKMLQMACYTASVAFWKRSWIMTTKEVLVVQSQSQTSASFKHEEWKAQEQAIMQQIGTSIPRLHNKEELFSHLQSRLAISNNNGNEMQTTCLYLSALVGEFSGKSSVPPYRLPMEFHKKSHKCFEEEEHLLHCLELEMEALASIVNNVHNHTNTTSGSLSSTASSTVAVDQTTAVSVVQLTIVILEWEFGMSQYLQLPVTSILIRPPATKRWRDYLMRPEFLGAIFVMHDHAASQDQPQLAHSLRQLLLLLCSLSGPIFQEARERESFAQYLCEGTCQLLRTCGHRCKEQEPQHEDALDDESAALVLDTVSLVARLFTNFRLAILSKLPSTLIPLLQELRKTGTALLHANVRDCEAAGGDTVEHNNMDRREWREEALSILLQAILVLSGDQWLQDPNATNSSQEFRNSLQTHLAQSLGPLYTEFVTCRMRMRYLEEYYHFLANSNSARRIRTKNTKRVSLLV